jgi:hypothetical protein
MSLILCVLMCRENLTDVWLWGTFVFESLDGGSDAYN